MIQRALAERVLGRALATGGEFAEIFLEDTRANSLVLLQDEVERANTARMHGAGIRVWKNLFSVYVHTCQTDEAHLLQAAGMAADAIGAGQPARAQALIGSVAANLHPVAQLPSGIAGSRKAGFLRAASAAAREYDPAIARVQCALSDVDSEVTICNSEGLLVSDRRVRVRMSVSAVAADGGENQTGHEAPGGLCGYELFENGVDPEQVGREAARTAVTMLTAPQCPAGEMPVVIDGGFGGVIFHEACGHSLEATAVALGNSEFCGRLGQPIASGVVTAIDDGTIPGAWGSLNIDDEGTPTNRLVLIENGILKNYMIDRLNALRMGMPPTGSARREDYTYAPTSRMRNTYIAPGQTPESEILSTMGDGLYARKMGGGSVNPLTGEFNFAVDEGYLVRDGRIAHPVRGATLVGRGSEVLMRIDRVGREMRLSPGMCGSVSGSVPVCVGQPMIRVSRLTVGGRE